MKFIKYFALLLYVMFFYKASSQNYIFNRITVNDGLLSNNIRTVWKDKLGYLWIGSENGLQRYDGVRFRTILKIPVEQFMSDNANNILIKSGTSIGTFNLNTFLFTPVSYEGSQQVYSKSKLWLRKDASGNIFLQIVGKSCQYFSEKSGSFSTINNPFSSPSDTPIFDVADDVKNDGYWILSDRGISFWDKKTKRYRHDINRNNIGIKNKSNDVTNIYTDNFNNLWLLLKTGAASSFQSYNILTNELSKDAGIINRFQGNNYVDVYGVKNLTDSSAVFYGLNLLILRVKNRYYNLQTNGNTLYDIQFNSVSDIFQDSDNIIWVATDNGLYFTSGISENIHILFSQKKQRNPVSSILQDKNGNLWIATWGKGIFLFKQKISDTHIEPVQTINNLDKYAKMVWSLCEDNDGAIWIGCQQGRLVKYNVLQKKSTLFETPALKQSSIRQIVKDASGTLWLGLDDGRILNFDPSESPVSNKSFKEICNIHTAITKILFVNEKYIWVVAKDKGILVLDAATGNIVKIIEEDNDGKKVFRNIRDLIQLNDTTCIAVGDILATINTRTYKASINVVKNLYLTGTIYTIQKDKNHLIWLGCTNGIFKLNIEKNILTKYTQQDGLITIHNNSYVPERSIQLKNGLLAFGGNQHLLIFDPSNYTKSKVPADVTVTGFQLDNNYLSMDSINQIKEIQIPYRHGSLSIDFASLSFHQKDKLFYEYKLEGIDKQWVEQNNASTVTYNFLPYGRYRFLVRAKNEMGQYAAKTTFLNLYIKPPFWKTLWFYGLLILLVTIILFYLHKLRLQKLLHIEKVRSRLARDLHDDMGSTLSTINILSSMALTQKHYNESENKEYMSVINANTSQMMDAMDDIVWSINPANDSIAKVMARIKEVAASVLEPKNVELLFETDTQVMDVQLPMEKRRELFLIFKEALNNSVKYSNSTKVIISILKQGNKIIFSVKDNGKGFSVRTQSTSVTRGNGLVNMNKRAGNLKGTLLIDAAPDFGTLIQVTFPIA